MLFVCAYTHAHTPIPQFIHCDFYRPDLTLSFFCKWNGICNISISTLNVLLPKLPSQHLKSLERRAKIALSVYKSKCRKGQTQLCRGLQSAKPHRGTPGRKRVTALKAGEGRCWARGLQLPEFSETNKTDWCWQCWKSHCC